MKLHDSVIQFIFMKSLYLISCSVVVIIATQDINTDIYNNLIKKYSNAAESLNVEQFQLLLDSVYRKYNDTVHVESNCKPISSEECRISQQADCFTAQQLFDQVSIQDGKMDVNSLNYVCPMILSQMESNVCNEGSLFPKKLEKERPLSWEVWCLGLAFVTIISLCSLVGVGVMPFMQKDFYNQLLTVLIGLAVGSLSGSAVFHLIPQAFGLMNNEESRHAYLNVSLMIWGGIWIFFMIERILKMIGDKNKQHKQPAASTNISSPTELLPEAEPLDVNTQIHTNPGTIYYEFQEQAIKASFGHQEKPKVSHNTEVHFEQGKDSVIATVAWMVIFGDGIHNFIDGLSIGAAFSESILTGISISLAVLFEEFPHELGDFAVLLNAGMSIRQAMTYNFISACTCYLGLVFGIILGDFQASTYIFGFAGGMFLYISLVDMVPEMNEVAEEAGKSGFKNACKTLLLQNIGIGIGVTALYCLAQYQEKIAFT